MSDATNVTSATSTEGSAAPAAGTTPPNAAGVAPGGSASPAEQGASAAAEHARVRNALRLVKEHPLGAVATVAAAAAFIEVEFAVGLLAGLGATALLAGRSGPENRRQVLSRGKLALDRARTAWARSGKPKPTGAAPQAAEAAPPPS